MIRFIDISHHQSGLDLTAVSSRIDAVVIKATDGTGNPSGYGVDEMCDGFFQEAKYLGLLRGFYHYGGSGPAAEEAEYFYNNCKNYFGDAIPVLDWEEDQTVDWVNQFVEWIHTKTGVWPWIYGNAWRFNQGGVNANCMRWIAKYPAVVSPTFADAETWSKPTVTDGSLVGAWQFCSDGRLSGYNGNLDLDLFYGDSEAWLKYQGQVINTDNSASSVSVLENDEYKITVERK